MFAMRFPSYLNEVGGKYQNGTHPNPRTFKSPETHDLEFLKKLKSCYDAINSDPKRRNVVEIKAQLDAWLLEDTQHTTKDNVQFWIQDQVAHAWEAISHMFQGTERDSQVFYNLVISRDDSKDGDLVAFIDLSRKAYNHLITSPASHTMSATDPSVKTLTATPIFPNIARDRLKIKADTKPPAKVTPGDHGSATSNMEMDAPASDMVNLASATNKPHYILYSKVPADHVHADVDTFRLEGGSPLDNFVGLLHSQKLGLESKPGALSSAPFLSTDEWSSWLADAISASSFITKTDAQGKVSGFSLQVKWHPDKTQTVKFGTDFVASSFNIPPPLEGPPIGLLGSTDIILMGLDMTQGVELVTDIAGALKIAGLTYSSALFPQVGLKLSTAPEASDGARNGVWFEPRKSYRTTLRLQWDIPEVDKIKEYLGTFLKGAFEIKSVRFITRRTASWATGRRGVSVVSAGEVILSTEIKVGESTFTGAVTFGENTLRMDLTTNANVFGGILTWLANTIGDVPFADWLKGNESVFKNILLRRVTLMMKLVNGQRKLTHFSVMMEIALGLGGKDKDNPVRVKVTYASRVGGKAGKLRGELWFSG